MKFTARICSLVLAFLLCTSVAGAHDISDRNVEGITNSIQVSVWKDLIFIDYWIAIGTIESVNYLPLIDADKDGEITEDEKLSYLGEIRKKVMNSAFTLSIDDQRNIPLKQWKPGTIVIEEKKDAPVPIKIGLEFVLDLANFPISVTAGGEPPRSDAHERSAPYPLRASGRTGEHDLIFRVGNIMDKMMLVKVYVNQDEWVDIKWTPEEYQHCLGLSSGIYLKTTDMTWAKFTYALLDKPSAQASPFSFNQAPVNDKSSQKLQVQELLGRDVSFGIIIIALLAAFAYGAGHALAPGHGKTLVAAYLVGSSGTVWQAIFLGLIVTFTHIFTVIVAGVIALWASSSIHQATLSIYLGIISGLIVIIIGAMLFIRRAFVHQAHGHDHGHEHHGHSQTLPAERERSPERSIGIVAGGEVKLRHILGLGISGGMVPCPTAIVILLLAVSIRKIAWGLALIGAFSLGLASVLIVIGILMVSGSSLLNRFSGSGRIIRILSIISPFLITIIGFAIVFKAFMDAGVIIINTGAMP